MIGVIEIYKKRIVKNSLRFVEGNAVFWQIADRFICVPFKFHSGILAVAGVYHYNLQGIYIS